MDKTMTILDNIKIKTQQLAMKTDQALREYGVETGMFLGAASIVVGIAGIAAMSTVAVPGAVVAAPIAAAASLASGTGLTVLGVSLNAAGSTLLAGGFAGIAFSAFSKLYKSIRNTDVFHDQLTGYSHVKCVKESGDVVELPSLKFYEMVEKGTLKDSFKEVIGNIHVGNGVHEERRYLPTLTVEQASFIQGDNNSEKIRRLLFKETKDMDFASKLSDTIKNIRNKHLSNNSQNKFSI